MWRRFAAELLVILTPAGAFASEDQSGPIACVATRPDAVKAWVDSLRFGLTEDYAWATGKVHVLLKNNSEVEYTLQGKARSIPRQLTRNRIEATFSYPDFSCVVAFGGITSVQNCSSAGERRSCDVGIDVLGAETAYSVSLSAERLTRELKMP